jgi:hypothetical protein
VAAPQVVESGSVTGTGTITFTTASTTAVDDYIFAAQITLVGAAHQTAPTTGTWTTLGTQANGANCSIRVWYRPVTAAGAQTVSLGGSYGGTFAHFLLVAVVRGVEVANPLDASAFSTSTTTSLVLTGVTTTKSECLLLGLYGGRSTSATASNFTPQGSMTELQDLAGASRSQAGAASEDFIGPGASGTRTISTAVAFNTAGALIAVRPAHVPINTADSGTATDSASVAATLSAADTATGAEQTGLTASLGATDTGFGTEQVGFYAQTNAADTGAGADTGTATALQSASRTDTGTGSESVQIVSLLSPTADAGTGSEQVGLLRQSTIPDTATAAEVLSIGPIFRDSGVGTESVTIREITATRVLPLVPERRYEVTVAARIQQASGAPTFLEVEAVTWLSLAYTDTISAPQDLTLTCQLATLPENVLTHLRRPDLFPFELWVRRDGALIFAGPLQGWQVQDQKVTIKAAGLLQYLAMMGVETDRTFTATDQAVVVKTLVDAWQTTQYGHFGIDTTHMTPTGRLVDQAYVRDELPGVLRAVTELGTATGGFDLEVDPESRQLITWSPQRGTDRSEGEDAIVLDTRNVTSSNLLLSVAPADLASDVFATGSKSGGDAPLFSQVSNSELRAKYGRTVMTRSWSNVADQPTLDAYAAAVRDARGEAFIVPGTKVRVTPDADIADYREGDTVSYDLGGELGTSGAFRIRSRTVTVDESGRESVDLEPV